MICWGRLPYPKVDLEGECLNSIGAEIPANQRGRVRQKIIEAAAEMIVPQVKMHDVQCWRQQHALCLIMETVRRRRPAHNMQVVLDNGRGYSGGGCVPLGKSEVPIA